MSDVVVLPLPNGIQAAFGLHWDQVEPDATAEEIRGKAEHVKAKQMVVMSNDDEAVAGFVPKDAKLPRKGTLVSAAALFARHPSVPENALLVLGYEEAGFVAVVRNGIPVIKYDFAGTPDEAIETAREYISLPRQENVLVYGNVRELPGIHPFTEEDLAAGDTKAAKIVAIPSGWASKVAGAVILLVLLASAAAGYHWWDKQQQEERRRQAMRQQDPNVAYEASIGPALASAGSRADSLLPEMFGAIGLVEPSVGGWKITTIDCTVEQCAVSWKSDGGNYDTFQEAMPKGYAAAVVAVDRHEIVQTVKASAPAAPAPLDRASLPSLKDFLAALDKNLADAETAGGKVVLHPPTPFGVPPGVKAEAVAKPVRSGLWEISGPFWLAEALKTVPPNMTLGGVQVRITDNGISFVAKGQYYVSAI